MTYAADRFDGLFALLFNQLLGAYDRTGTVSGCDVTLVDNTSAIEFSVADGTVNIDGDPVNVAAHSTTAIDANTSTLPRRDVLWIDTAGSLQVRTGTPMPYRPSRDPDGDGINELAARATIDPPPDTMDDLLVADGTPMGVVVATVIIPSGAQSSADLSDDDWTERHIRVPSTAGAGSHDSLTDVSSADHHARYTASEAVNDTAALREATRTLSIPDATIAAADEAQLGHVDIPSGLTGRVTETQVHDSAGDAQSTLQLAVVDGTGTDVYTSTARRDATPGVSLTGADTLTVELRNQNASGGADASGGAHVIIILE